MRPTRDINHRRTYKAAPLEAFVPTTQREALELAAESEGVSLYFGHACQQDMIKEEARRQFPHLFDTEVVPILPQNSIDSFFDTYRRADGTVDWKLVAENTRYAPQITKLSQYALAPLVDLPQQMSSESVDSTLKTA